jgi:hypothetical protein
MIWIIDGVETIPADARDDAMKGMKGAGRYVVHRHRDEDGPHLDLRLEHGDCLIGWRIAGTALAEGVCAEEKSPHPLHWLEKDGECVREDAGQYAWLSRDAQGGGLLLRGADGERILRLRRTEGLPADCILGLRDLMDREELSAADLAGLIEDGLSARGRALARFQGLGRELDGPAFDGGMWRKTLAPLSLREIHRHLEQLELRFDAEHPPLQVSRPEPLEDGAAATARGRVLDIVRG